MTEKEAYEIGYDEGYTAAKANIDRNLSYDENFENAWEGHENSRQYSPFEFIAQEINEDEDSEELWDSFDEGVSEGIKAYLLTVFPEESD
jgi:hypothetical protein